MGKDLIDINFIREDPDIPWGFRLSGGKDFGQPLSISQVSKNSLAAKVGMAVNDLLISVGPCEVHDMTHAEAERTINEAGNRFSMVIERHTSRKISFEKSATTFALKLGGGHVEVERKDEAFISNIPITEDTPSMALDSVNFKKFEKSSEWAGSETLQDVGGKATQKKDWNCPWVKPDGRGLKQFIRYIDEPTAPAKTSQHHYYSEPRSILGSEPQLTEEQLQELIREHGGESRPESRAQGRDETGIYTKAEAIAHQQQQEMMMQQQQQESIAMTQQQQHSMAMTQTQQTTQNIVETNSKEVSFAESRDRELDSQAPPELESVSQGFSMPSQEQGYEPSADELIDVLKNLENLAAGNPNLYRSIVQQIKVANSYDGSGRDTPNYLDQQGKVSDLLSEKLTIKSEEEVVNH